VRLRIHIAQIPRCLHADRYDPNVPRLLNCRKIPIALIDRGFECNRLVSSIENGLRAKFGEATVPAMCTKMPPPNYRQYLF
jgi:hypothetical protein